MSVEPQSKRAHPDPLPESASRLAERRARHRQDQHSLIATAVTMVGLGWLVVIPTLAGMYVGRWLDGKTSHGVTFSAGLGLLGLSVGCVMAWQKVSTHRPKQ